MTAQVVIYGRSAPVCHFCIQAKKMADKAGLDFEYKDISKGDWDIEGLEDLLEQPIRTVPVVLIDNEFIGGARELAAYIQGLAK